MKNIIEVKNISFKYPEQSEIFKDLSFEIKRGEWTAIIGQNGSGKSTIAKLIDGLYQPMSGEIFVDDLLVNEENINKIHKKIGLVFQNPDDQFVGATVEDDVAFGLENQLMSTDEMHTIVEKSLKSVNMWEYRERVPESLSGGQKQRVAIAGIIALAPQIIILDESTSMLDPLGRKDIIDLIYRLKQELNLTVISITHDIDEAALADRIMILNQGQLVEATDPNDMFSNEDKLLELGLDVPYTVKLMDALRQQGLDVPRRYMDEGELVKWITQLK